jgi:protein-disulfide isomerase
MNARVTARIEIILTIVMALSSAVVAAQLVRNDRREAAGHGAGGAAAVADWRSYMTRGERLGSVTAKNVIVEFSDFQCPYCRRFRLALDSLVAKHPGDVAVLYRHAPIPQHPYAAIAAAASVCAARQGRFAEYHDLLFSHQDSIGHVSWTAFATRAGVADTVTFATCLRDDIPAQALALDRKAAERLGVRGTPTAVVNGWLVRGAATEATLEALLSKSPP